MQLQTKVDIERGAFAIGPQDRMLFVGSCFAADIGRRFVDSQFHTEVNPYGTMYNPASVWHSVDRVLSDDARRYDSYDVVVMTLGTNRVYILNETGEIVDNCRKRPQQLFTELSLSVDECADYLVRAISRVREANKGVRVVVTVSPIRYAKYGFHGSRLSKATLLLAADEVVRQLGQDGSVAYFPAYELMNDELRDYRFYQPDMLHPSEQAVDYIFMRFTEAYLSAEGVSFMKEWEPIRQALAHRPFDAESADYKAFLRKAKEMERAFRQKWNV